MDDPRLGNAICHLIDLGWGIIGEFMAHQNTVQVQREDTRKRHDQQTLQQQHECQERGKMDKLFLFLNQLKQFECQSVFRTKLQDLVTQFAANGELTNMQELLERYPIQNLRAPLFKAVSNSRHQVVKFLCKLEEKKNSSPTLLEDALWLAIEIGHYATVQAILGFVDPTTKRNRALRDAARHGHRPIVKLLLANSNVDIKANRFEAISSCFGHGMFDIAEEMMADIRMNDVSPKVGGALFLQCVLNKNVPESDLGQVVRIALKHKNIWKACERIQDLETILLARIRDDEKREFVRDRMTKVSPVVQETRMELLNRCTEIKISASLTFKGAILQQQLGWNEYIASDILTMAFARESAPYRYGCSNDCIVDSFKANVLQRRPLKRKLSTTPTPSKQARTLNQFQQLQRHLSKLEH
uniref:Uncharacterized protein n=1 Tax=Mucochytrium quahogii TaxID=96639 RepID=A0A7S2SFL7_9STRA|mmetsp:Transcript_5160/g.11395  ORF Transcript_5160/g.11395 Transcript_5160/m.11395 type:complete len:414 (+) Transcript_5160:153-1394(+)